jgi:glutamate-ammonia-ligase adenylyltransferase
MSYQSDLDLILVYEGDGRTRVDPEAGSPDGTDNFHFFTELAQRIIRMTSIPGPMGRLYEVDMRLRPTGKSGSLVIPLDEFEKYYQTAGAQLWERQALTRARVVHADDGFTAPVMQAIERAAYDHTWQARFADHIRGMRERMEASGGERDLKRGFGGIVDIEFLVQLFKLKYGRSVPAIRATNTWDSLTALHDVGLLDDSAFSSLCQSYDFFRTVEARLRIVHNRSLDELPDTPEDLDKLARRLGLENNEGRSAGDQLLLEIEGHTSRTRALFLELVQRERDAISFGGRR